jgi:hypothetical protein
MSTVDNIVRAVSLRTLGIHWCEECIYVRDTLA